MKKKTKQVSQVKEAMATLGAIGGSSNVRKNGKRHMSKIIKNYWASPASQQERERRAKLAESRLSKNKKK